MELWLTAGWNNKATWLDIVDRVVCCSWVILAKSREEERRGAGEVEHYLANDAARGHSAELYQDKAKRTVIEAGFCQCLQLH